MVSARTVLIILTILVVQRFDQLLIVSRMATLPIATDNFANAPPVFVPPSPRHPQIERKNEPPPLVGVVSAFTDDHRLEAVNFVRSLISVGYDGPLTMYAMYKPGEPPPSTLLQWVEFRDAVAKSPLGPASEVIDYEVSSGFGSYCFKAEVLRDYLYRHSSMSSSSISDNGAANHGTRTHSLRPLTILWSDSSMRFTLNPAEGARRMLEDRVGLAGFTAKAALAAMTHPGTFTFLGLGESVDIYRNLTEEIYPGAGGTCFHVNLMEKSMVREVLEPFLNCGTRNCCTCFAPPGSAKYHGTSSKRGYWRRFVDSKHNVVQSFCTAGNSSGVTPSPPPRPYVYHRQDASVLSTLLYEWLEKGSIKGNRTASLMDHHNGIYLRGDVGRGNDARSASDLNAPGPNDAFLSRHEIRKRQLPSKEATKVKIGRPTVTKTTK